MTEPTPIPESELAAMQARCDAATLGWIEAAWLDSDGWDTAKSNRGHYSGAPCPDVTTEEQAQRDCEFAANARTDMPRLIAEVQYLKVTCNDFAERLLDSADRSLKYNEENSRLRSVIDVQQLKPSDLNILRHAAEILRADGHGMADEVQGIVDREVRP